MSDREKVFQDKLNAALQEYVSADVDDPGMVMNWAVVYTKVDITGEDVLHANAVIFRRGGDPNAVVGLGAWLQDVGLDILLEGVEDDE